MTKSYIIGLDLGTTSVKACVFDRKGHLVVAVEEMITSYYPQPSFVEQRADHIEQLAKKATFDAVKQSGVKKEEVIALSFSAAMHSLLALNELGEPISPATIWADGRSAELAEQIDDELKRQIYERTGTPFHPMTPLLKLLWMKEQQYEPYKQAAYFMSIKEYIIYCWCGVRMIDYSMASATGMFDPQAFIWNNAILELVGVKQEQLSHIVPPTTILPSLKPEVARELGVAETLPLVIGAADGQLSNLGIGAIAPGEIAVSVGTSGAIRQFTNTVQTSSVQATFCYAFDKEQYIIGGPTNNGGIVLQWLKQMLEDEREFPQFIGDAEGVDAGAEGLLFLPYLNGERAPIWNQLAKGSFYGLTVTHKKQHMIRAVLEGITFNLYEIDSAIQASDNTARKIYVNGGLSRSPIWLQMMADVFNAEIYVSENHHGAAWGAAWTALVGLGLEQSFMDIKHNIPMGQATLPNPAQVEKYRKVFANYSKLSKFMTALYH